MRVLHIHSGNGFGGIPQALIHLCRAGKHCADFMQEFALCYDARLATELRRSGGVVHVLGPARLRSSSSVIRANLVLRNILKGTSFDCAIVHCAWDAAVLGYFAKQHVKVFAFYDHTVPGRNVLERIYPLIAKPAIHIANSQFVLSSRQKTREYTRSVCVYLPFNAPETRPSSARLRTRAALDVEPTTLVLVQVSRMIELKGHTLLLDALSRLKHLSTWTAWIVGGPLCRAEEIYYQRLHSMVSDMGLRDRIRFLGQRTDVTDLLAAADIFCQPNVGPEGFGLTFIEALSADLPVVGTNIGGPSEIIDGSCGFAVIPRPAEVATALFRLLADEELRRTLGRNGRRRVSELCEPLRQIELLRGVLARAVSTQ